MMTTHHLNHHLNHSALPFILGERETLAKLPDECGAFPITKIPINCVSSQIEVQFPTDDSLDSVTSFINPARFTRLLNLANGVCYGGGMGMPEWVMLDCALLPSCFIGWMTPAEALSEEVRITLNRGLTEVEIQRAPTRADVEEQLEVKLGTLASTEWVPTSEFCSIPRLISEEVVGYSLYSLKRGLGVRSKALGLWVMGTLGVSHQIGVAQWSNLAALRAHLRFGPLELIDPLTPLHTRAGETMIYRLTLPHQHELQDIALGSCSNTQTFTSLVANQKNTPKNTKTPVETSSKQQLNTEKITWIQASNIKEWLKIRQQALSLESSANTKIYLVDARRNSTGVELAIVSS